MRGLFPFKCWLSLLHKQQGDFHSCPWIIDFLLALNTITLAPVCCFVAGYALTWISSGRNLFTHQPPRADFKLMNF